MLLNRGRGVALLMRDLELIVRLGLVHLVANRVLVNEVNREYAEEDALADLENEPKDAAIHNAMLQHEVRAW